MRRKLASHIIHHLDDGESDSDASCRLRHHLSSLVTGGCRALATRRRQLQALLSEAGSRDWSVLFLVQWPLLRNFSDQLNRGRVETCLLLFFGQILLRVLTAATRELVASLMPFLGQPRKN